MRSPHRIGALRRAGRTLACAALVASACLTAARATAHDKQARSATMQVSAFVRGPCEVSAEPAQVAPEASGNTADDAQVIAVDVTSSCPHGQPTTLRIGHGEATDTAGSDGYIDVEKLAADQPDADRVLVTLLF